MLQSLARAAAIPPILVLSLSGAGQILASAGEREPGRVTPEELAAEPNFAKPLGAAQATMAKIAADASAHGGGHGMGEAAMQAQIMAAGQAAIPVGPRPATPQAAPRGMQLDLRA